MYFLKRRFMRRVENTGHKGYDFVFYIPYLKVIKQFK